MRSLSTMGVLALLALGGGAAGCGRSEAGGGTSEIRIGCVGNRLAYDRTEFRVREGSLVVLSFANTATREMYHNLLVVRPGTQEHLAWAGVEAGYERGWIPEDPALLAHTRLLRPGEEDTIRFRAPPVGDYPYFCSVPGHAPFMKGVMHVR